MKASVSFARIFACSFHIFSSKPLERLTPSQWRPGLIPYLLGGAPRPRLIQLCFGTSCGTMKPANRQGR